MRALIVESGFTRGALAGARALVREGWQVGIGSPRPAGLANWSRATTDWHRVPAVEDDLDAFIDATNVALRAGGYDVVFPAADAEAMALSAERDRLDAVVPYPPHDAVVRAFDKLDLLIAAEGVGLQVPRTVPATAAELDAIEGPVVVKSRLHWAPGGGQPVARIEAALCRDRDEAARRAAEMRSDGGQPLLQEVVAGRMLHLIAVVDRRGRRLAEVQTMSAPLSFPPGAGMRVRSETVTVDADLVAGFERLLAELGWIGMASVMFLVGDDGPKLVDFNGRFVASFDASLAAGPNLAALWAAVATDQELPASMPARTGVRFQWLEGDLRRALVERRGGLVRDLIGCLAYALRSTHTLLRLRDPWPGIRFSGTLIARAIRKSFRRARS